MTEIRQIKGLQIHARDAQLAVGRDLRGDLVRGSGSPVLAQLVRFPADGLGPAPELGGVEGAGTVIQQNPAAGRTAAGATVTIRPSNGQGVAVPAVSGKPADAVQALRSAGTVDELTRSVVALPETLNVTARLISHCQHFIWPATMWWSPSHGSSGPGCATSATCWASRRR